MNRVLVIGDVMVDEYIEGRVERISPEAPVPIFLTEKKILHPGGAANVACNVMSLGGKCTLLGVVGPDQAADRLVEALNLIKILSGIFVEKGRVTTTKTRLGVGGHQIIRVDSESVYPVSPATEDWIIESISELIKAGLTIVLSDYAKGVLTDRVIRSAIQMGNKYNLPVIVDPKGGNFNRYEGATVIKPNVRELHGATGMPVDSDKDVVAACQYLIDFTGIKYVLATRGEKGMTLVTKGGGAVHTPAQTREISDVAGAGDTALAALAFAMSCGKSVEESVPFANKAAGIVVSKRGTASVTMDELERENI